MTKTNAQLGFKTRYRLQVIDSHTGKPVSEEIRVNNIVLRSGMLALGDAVAYTHISIGTSDILASADQTGLISPAVDLPLSEGTFTQTIDTSPTSNDIISRITREFVFKEFRFPSNARTLTLREIGITGVTRAVLPTPLEINQSHWVKVQLEIDYTYKELTNQSTPIIINTQPPTGVLEYTVTPFVYNPTPSNDSGKGYGGVNSVLGYVWNGLSDGVSNKTFGATIGMVVNRVYDRDNCSITFIVTGSAIAESEIPGFIIRDTINGGAFKFQFPNRLIVAEDDSIDLRFTYSWRQDQTAIV